MQFLRLLVRGLLYIAAGLVGILVLPLVLFILVPAVLIIGFTSEILAAVDYTLSGDDLDYISSWDSLGVKIAKWAFGLPTLEEYLATTETDKPMVHD